jgi:predicted ATP-grasp superfamily ATP-dependent carboligase
MGGRRILIVGRSSRAFAESATRAGYECESVDAFGDLDQKARVENVALTRDLGRSYSAGAAVAVARRRFNAKSAAYVANLENHPTAVRRLARGRALLGNTPETLAGARDFRQLANVVVRAGARVPVTVSPGEVGPLTPGRRWLRKPIRGGGGNGVREWMVGRPVPSGELVQEMVEGTLASMAFAADGRRAVVLGFARGLAGEAAFGGQGYRYCGSLHPYRLEAALRTRMDAIAQATTRAFRLVGVNGIDFVVRDGEAYVLELNPRYSASMELLERSGGMNVFEVHVAACGGALPPPFASPAGEAQGKAILWARRDTVVGDTRPWLSRDDVRDLPFPGERIGRGHPICTVFARGPDDSACYRHLLAAAEALEREIEGQPSGAHP